MGMYTTSIRTEHGGHKGSGRKSGFWGVRYEAKLCSRKARRLNGKKLIREELAA